MRQRKMINQSKQIVAEYKKLGWHVEKIMRPEEQRIIDYQKESGLIAKEVFKTCKQFAKKIAPVYYQLNWTWASIVYQNSQFGGAVPDEQDLYIELLRLVDEVTKHETEWEVATGGLRVKKECFEKERWITLSMEINSETDIVTRGIVLSPSEKRIKKGLRHFNLEAE